MVSALDYKRTQLAVQQLQQRLEIEQQRTKQLQAMQMQQVKIQQDLITQFELAFITVEKRLLDLNVRAGSGEGAFFSIFAIQALSANASQSRTGRNQRFAWVRHKYKFHETAVQSTLALISK